jgi:hypothetical protein
MRCSSCQRAGFCEQLRFDVRLQLFLSQASVLMLKCFNSLHQRQLSIQLCPIIGICVEIVLLKHAIASRSAIVLTLDGLYVVFVACLDALQHMPEYLQKGQK